MRFAAKFVLVDDALLFRQPAKNAKQQRATLLIKPI